VVGLYSRPQAAIVVLAFEARIVGGAAKVTPEALEVRAFAPDAIPWSGIAFKTSLWAIRDWVHRVRPDLDGRLARSLGRALGRLPRRRGAPTCRVRSR
jgi:hypothetical protein